MRYHKSYNRGTNRTGSGFDVRKAIQSRQDLAMQQAGTSRLQIMEELVAKATKVIEDEMAARELAPRDDAGFVAMMRELGGYSAIIKSFIGPEPDPMPNSLGMSTNPAHCIWQVKMEMVERVRQQVQGGQVDARQEVAA